MLLAYRRPPDRQQHDLHDRRRRVALPAPHRPGKPAAEGGSLAAREGAGQPLRQGRPSAAGGTGPVVRVARGNDVTVVPVGAR